MRNLDLFGVILSAVKEPERYMLRGIQQRIAITILIVGMFPVIIGTFFFYLQGRKELMESVGQSFAVVAEEITSNIEGIIDHSINSVHTIAFSPVLRETLKKKLSGKKESYGKIQDLELQWLKGEQNNELLKKYLENRASRYLADVKKQTQNLEELFITDNKGMLIASASKTKYLFFGEESWWRAAYNDGKGDTYLGEIYLDPDRNQYLQRIVLPVRDEDGQILGIIHAAITIDRISQVIQKFRVGNTGHAMLINSAAVILICPIFSPRSHKITTELMKKITMPSEGWSIVKDNAHGGKNAIAGFDSISYSIKGSRNSSWYIFVSQSPSESFAPIHTLLKRLASILLLSVIILSGMGFLAARRIVQPIKLLQKGTEIIGGGDLNYRIDVRTGDEIEVLANDFNKMVEQIHISYSELEQHVSDRTKELQTGYQEMETISRLKSEFLANMSHELRTPLNSILGFSEMLQDCLIGKLNDKQQKYTGYIHESGKHLLELINSILDLSKIEAGMMAVIPEQFSVRKSIDEVYSIIHPLASKKNIDIHLDISDGVSDIVADKMMFKQIMYNLLSNAVKFTGEGGEIKINATSNDFFLQASIIDNGIGIEEDNLKMIFNEFTQADSSTSKEYEGTGLGLTLTKRFIEIQGGMMTVESDVGVGSNFTFRIPVNVTTDNIKTES